MPSLQGYAVRTHSLPGGRDLDILHRPNNPQYLLSPAQQVLALTEDGRRADGFYSSSDVAKRISPEYVRKEPDPRRIYSRSRAMHTTLFSVEGLIERIFHTFNPQYVPFCREFIEYILPEYRDFARYNAELIMAWYEAIDHYEITDTWLSSVRFQTAVKARDARLEKDPEAVPMLLFGMVGCERVLCSLESDADDQNYLGKTPLCPTESVIARGVADLAKAHDQAGEFANLHPDAPRIVPHLAIARSSGAIWLTDPELRLIADGKPTVSREKPGPTAEDIQEGLRAIVREEMAKTMQTREDHVHQAAVIKLLTQIVDQSTELNHITTHQMEVAKRSQKQAREALILAQQTIDLVTPSHQLLLPASDYFEMDGVEEALKRAPRLAEPVFGLVHCPDHGTASLFMKLLCREEDKKVAANAVERIIATDAGLEEPPLYIPRYRMERRERDHVQVLMFNPACWARLKQVFLPPDTPTLLFPGPRVEPMPETGKTEEA